MSGVVSCTGWRCTFKAKTTATGKRRVIFFSYFIFVFVYMCVCILLTLGHNVFSLSFFFSSSPPNKSSPLNKDGNKEKSVMAVLAWREGSLPWGSLGRGALGLRGQPGCPPFPPRPSRRVEVPRTDPPHFDHGR